MERITSRKNPLLTQIRKLAAGSGRDRRAAGEYLGDGRKLLEEALKWHAPLTTVVVSEGVELPNLPPEVRAVQGAQGRDGDHLPHEDPPGGPCFWPAFRRRGPRRR